MCKNCLYMKYFKEKGNKTMRTKRILATIMAVILSAGVMTSCGEKKTETGKTEISIGNWPQKEGANLDNYNQVKAEYETQYADVTIVPDNWSFDLQTFYPKAEAGLLPTLFSTYATEMQRMKDSGYVADLSEALKDNGYDGMFNPKILDLISKDDKVYALPWSGTVFGLAYNTEMMQAAGLMEEDGTPKQPKDWNEMAEFAVKIKEATGKPGFVIPTANNNGGWIFTSIAWSYGVDFMEQQEDGTWKATFNTPEAEQALQFIKDLKWKYDVLPANALIDYAEYMKTFATGGAGMAIQAGDIASKVTQYEMQPDTLGMMALPRGPQRWVTLLSCMLDCISAEADEKQIDAAIKWYEMFGRSFKLTDASKKSIENKIAKSIEEGELIGIKSMQVWNDSVESIKFENELIDKNINSNLNHVKLYNDFVKNSEVECQVEEPVCAQDLYGILDNCIQEVFENKNADCKEILEKANTDFQKNYLDNI